MYSSSLRKWRRKKKRACSYVDNIFYIFFTWRTYTLWFTRLPEETDFFFLTVFYASRQDNTTFVRYCPLTLFVYFWWGKEKKNVSSVIRLDTAVKMSVIADIALQLPAPLYYNDRQRDIHFQVCFTFSSAAQVQLTECYENKCRRDIVDDGQRILVAGDVFKTYL